MKLVLILMVLFYCTSANCQFDNNRWLVGYSPTVQVIFNDSSMIDSVYYIKQPYRFTDGHSNISKAGSIPLSCNGYFLFNGKGELIENGDSLVPNKLLIDDNGSSTYVDQSLIIPKNKDNYYVFVSAMSNKQYDNCVNGGTCKFDILTYSIVDMNENGRSGKVVLKEKHIIEDDSMRSALSACKHANGRDWWVVVPHYFRHAYYKLLVTPDTILGPYFQDLGAPSIPFHRLMQTNFSLDGTMYTYTQNNEPDIVVDKFDRCTGLFTSYKVLNPPKDISGQYAGIGNCFSPNGNFLYLCSPKNIYQYDIENEEFIQLMVDSLNVKDNQAAAYGEDGKIYIGNFHKTDGRMSYIRFPNKKGLACELCVLCYTANNVNLSNPPNMPNYALGALKGSPCDTLGKLQNQTMVVYPNPASNYLQVYFPQAMNSNVELALYDMLGQRVFSWNKTLNSKQEVVLSLPKLSVGLYTLQAEVNGDKYVAKVLIE